MKKSSLATAAVLFLSACPLIVTSSTRASVIEVPFEFDHDAIAVQVRVNQQGPFWMLLDSGADPSIVDLTTAKNIGLRLAARGQQGSGGGTDVNLTYETELPRVQLGELRQLTWMPLE